MNLAYPGAISYASDAPPKALVVLAHGAGAGQKHPFMIATARGLAARGFDVVTFDFPYMAQKRRAPDRPPVLEQAFREVIEAARQWSRARRLFIGGKSMGGRMATHLAAQQREGLDGVFALGYPLHPPGKPDQPRIAHLPDIVARVLIVQGERDTFGTPSELEPVIATMKAPVTLHVVEGGDHSLTVRGKKGAGTFEAVLDVIAAWLAH
jgi:predicted alpha/beta-hydrolase family hydrolase